jgi:hypothetical protein
VFAAVPALLVVASLPLIRRYRLETGSPDPTERTATS